jgi:hypothetical protein
MEAPGGPAAACARASAAASLRCSPLMFSLTPHPHAPGPGWQAWPVGVCVARVRAARPGASASARCTRLIAHRNRSVARTRHSRRASQQRHSRRPEASAIVAPARSYVDHIFTTLEREGHKI